MHQIGPSSLPAYIPVPSGGETLDVTNWNLLRFSPLGIYHLRRWQGAFPGIKDFFFSHQGRFRSADLAWFSSRLNRDGNHDHPRTSFHPSLATLHKDTNSPRGKIECKDLLAELKEQLFDIYVLYYPFCLSTNNLFFPGNNVRSINRRDNDDNFEQWYYSSRCSRPPRVPQSEHISPPCFHSTPSGSSSPYHQHCPALH